MKNIPQIVKSILRKELLVQNQTLKSTQSIANSLDSNPVLYNYFIFCLEDKLQMNIPDQMINLNQNCNSFVKSIKNIYENKL